MNKNLTFLSLILALTLFAACSIQPARGTTETTLIVVLYQSDHQEPIRGIPVTVLWGSFREDSEYYEREFYESGNTDELGTVIFNGFGDYEGGVLIKANSPIAPSTSGYAERVTAIQRGSAKTERLYLEVKNVDPPGDYRPTRPDSTGFYLGAGALITVAAVLLLNRKKIKKR